MRKFLWICVLALPLAAVSQQPASATGFEINWSGHWDYHFSWGFCCGCGDKGWCHKGHSGYAVPDCSYGDTSWGGYTGYCLDGYSGAGYGGYAAMPLSVAPAQSVGYGSYGFQPVGYFGVPSYWYGR